MTRRRRTTEIRIRKGEGLFDQKVINRARVSVPIPKKMATICINAGELAISAKNRIAGRAKILDLNENQVRGHRSFFQAHINGIQRLLNSKITSENVARVKKIMDARIASIERHMERLGIKKPVDSI